MAELLRHGPLFIEDKGHRLFLGEFDAVRGQSAREILFP
jgi:hypothetical protein